MEIVLMLMENLVVYLPKCYYRYPDLEGARQTSGFSIHQKFDILEKGYETLQIEFRILKLVFWS